MSRHQRRRRAEGASRLIPETDPNPLDVPAESRVLDVGQRSDVELIGQWQGIKFGGDRLGPEWVKITLQGKIDI